MEFKDASVERMRKLRSGAHQYDVSEPVAPSSCLPQGVDRGRNRTFMHQSGKWSEIKDIEVTLAK
jgi:hypothetical protein